MTERLSGARAFALLTDGTQIEIRRLGAADEEAVRELHRASARRACTCGSSG